MRFLPAFAVVIGLAAAPAAHAIDLPPSFVRLADYACRVRDHYGLAAVHIPAGSDDARLPEVPVRFLTLRGLAGLLAGVELWSADGHRLGAIRAVADDAALTITPAEPGGSSHPAPCAASLS